MDLKKFLLLKKKGQWLKNKLLILYNENKKPILSGKFDGKTKEKLIPETAELSSDIIADALLKKLNF